MQTVKNSLGLGGSDQASGVDRDVGQNATADRTPGYGAQPTGEDGLQNSYNTGQGASQGYGTGVPESGPAGKQSSYASRPEAKVTGTTASGGIIGEGLSSTPILGGEVEGAAPRTPVAQHTTFQDPSTHTTPVTEAVKQREARPAAYTERADPEGPDGMPSGYAARHMNPDNVNVNYAGNVGNYRNVGNHKNEGIGTNSGESYPGNTNSHGITDSKGNPLPGTPSVGTDGDRIGGSMGQSERGRSRAYYDNKAL